MKIELTVDDLYAIIHCLISYETDIEQPFTTDSPEITQVNILRLKIQSILKNYQKDLIQ